MFISRPNQNAYQTALAKEDWYAFPEFVLNILEMEQLRGITDKDEVVRIGSTVTFTEMVESEVLNRCFPLLVQAAASVGGPQVRNRGTIGGNIVNASPAADVLPAVLALGGQLELQSKLSGTRILPLARAVIAPYKTALRNDEILTGILIRKLRPGTRSAFEKLGRRNTMVRARMNMSVVLHLNEEGVISESRVVPGAVMPVARPMECAEAILLGRKATESLIEAAAEALAEDIVRVAGVRRSTEYKRPVVKNIFKRVLKQALE